MYDEFLAISPVNGLGNRLRSINSFFILQIICIYFILTEKKACLDNTKLNDPDVNHLNLIDDSTWTKMKNNSFSISDHIEGVCEENITFKKTDRKKYVNQVLTGY